MSTYQEIQDRVSRRLIDAPSAVTTEVPLLVNAALLKLQSLHNFKVMQYTQDYTTTVNTRALGSLPSDWKEARGKPYYVEELGNTREMDYAPQRIDVQARWATDDIGEPAHLLAGDPTTVAGARAWEVWPLPDGNADYANGEYRIFVPYWRYLPVLSAGGDTNWFTVNAEEWIIARATEQGFSLDWDEDRAKYWRGEAAKEWKDLLLRDKYEWLAGFETLVPHSGARAPHINN